MKLHELVALGGLLHDVGKPVERANLYSGDHSEQGAVFLRELARNSDRKEFELLAIFSEFHHSRHMENENLILRRIEELHPERFGLSVRDILRALWMVYEADNLSSTEREKGRPERVKPLCSIFNPKKAFRPVSIDFNKEFIIPEETGHLKAGDYREIVRGLWKDMLEVPPKIDRLLPILEKHLTLVSSVTAEGNVISLYDHMRMTSAIALAMLHAGCSEEDAKSGLCRKKKRFLLIEGDFSGIQDFIYGITGKGTLKYLRARSAYLELISWDVVLEILRRLGLTRANVVFNAGGHFLILAQNTSAAIEELKDIRKRAVEWLYREFDGNLYLALEWEPLSGEELGRKDGRNLFEEARKRLKKKLALKKLRRFEEVEGLFNVRKTGKLEECAVCGREVPGGKLEPFVLDLEAKVCRTCNELAELGKKLPRVAGFVLDRKAHESEGSTRGPFRYFIPYTNGEALGEFLLLRNTLTPPGNLREDVEFVPYFVAVREGEHGAATFEELAKNSTGAKRIGILKGDVDKLGLFFGGMDSPSKLATASRFVDYFFKAYLNGIIEGKSGHIIGSVPSIRGWPERPDIVVIYAGGDDFFIVGAWDQVFELAFRIRGAFEAYTGGGLTLSAGLGYFHPKTPIYRMASTVSKRLEAAKDEGRNRIFVVERTKPNGEFPLSYGWDYYIELWNNYASKVYHDDGRLRRGLESKKGFLRKLLEFREMYIRNPSDVRWAYLCAYHLGRHEVTLNGKKASLADVFPELAGIDARAVEDNRPQPIYWIDGVLKIVLMAVRR